MSTPGFANSSRARCAIYSRDTAICIYSVSRLSRKNSFVKISSWAKVMGPAEYFCRHILVYIFPNMAISQAKPYVAAPGSGHGRQAHGGTGLAPRHNVRCPWDFLGLINTSRMSLVRKNERHLAFSPADTPAVSRGIRSVGQFFSFTFST
jgi:hypothetical protein